ncbi:MAG: M14 family zinc carboxypeptidase [Lishizhenia sp.]
MNKLIVAITLCASFLSFSQEYSRVKIFTDHQGLQTLNELGVAVDHGKYKQNTFFISDFSTREIEIIQGAGFQTEILIEDVKAYYLEHSNDPLPAAKNTNCSSNGSGSSAANFDPTVPSNFTLGSMAGFYTYTEYLAEIDDMFAQYPNLISEKAPISNFTTHEGRSIYWMKISDNPNVDENEPEVMHTSIHHAREPGSLISNIFYMWYLLENYGTDLEVTYLVDNTELYFIPMINPDGYVHNVTNDPNGGGMHRKNKRNVGTSNPGVDLNRNYSYQWGTTGVSADVNSDVYPGTAPFSEPETQAMKWFVENHNIEFAFNCHTAADMILFPIGATNAEFAVDHDYFQEFTDHMARHNNYLAQKSSGLYPASGDSDDYMYKDEGVFAMTPEIGGEGFWPPQSSIIPECKEMLFPNLRLSHLTHKYAVTESTDPSSVDALTGNFNYTILRLGQENGDFTVSIEPLNGIQSVGSANTHSLSISQQQTDAISYTLNPSISYGDEVKYVISTDNGQWTFRDTITRTFGSATLQVFDNASNTSNWTGDFALTTSESYSPSTSFTDSPNGNYQNNSEAIYNFNQTIDLTYATAANISYYAKWEIETDWDYVQFQISTDGGNSWIAQCGTYTNEGVGGNTIQPGGEPLYDGIQNSWVFEEINLSDYLGETINVRFYLETDQAVREDGFYFDDFSVSYDLEGSAQLNEENLSLNIFPNPSNNEIAIALPTYEKFGTVEILDMNGKVVLNKIFEGYNNLLKVDVSHLENGFYFVNYIGETIQSTKNKIVVLK